MNSESTGVGLRRRLLIRSAVFATIGIVAAWDQAGQPRFCNTDTPYPGLFFEWPIWATGGALVASLGVLLLPRRDLLMGLTGGILLKLGFVLLGGPGHRLCSTYSSGFPLTEFEAINVDLFGGWMMLNLLANVLILGVLPAILAWSYRQHP